ncbi:MAG: membrane protein insertase YidC [Betaproteobacteria bacterium AqS2]|uniref:Membrane protein insertase YidC n=1 Tax=Candidatus Amphirhobacter heronislandensis TaxID=1732024 RepID=A0A930UHU8_9GAMM|nr:membrane protein insertase YidC [Betaproteobacteria bacterium AqS2]
MNRDFMRLLVTGAFAFSCLLLYQRWVAHQQERIEDILVGDSPPSEAAARPPAAAAPAPAASDEAVPEVTQQLTTPASDPEDELPAATPAPAAAAPAAVVATIANETVSASFNAGGDLVRLEMPMHRVSLNGPPLPLFLDTPSHHLYPQTGLLGDGLPTHQDAGWRYSEDLSSPGQAASVWTGGGVRITRSYVLTPEPYQLSVVHVVENNSQNQIAGHVYYQFIRDGAEPLSYASTIPSFYGAAIYTEADKYQKFDFDEFSDSYPKRVEDGWIGFIQRYFMAVWLDSGEARENSMRNLPNGDVAIGIIRPLAPVPPGAAATVAQVMYAGALEQRILKNIDEELGRNLSLAVDYGWLTLLAAPLFSLLDLIHQGVGNWGLAIVLLTVLIKLVFFPLSAKSYRSMARLRKVTPQLQAIRERYKDKREEFQKATMELYRKEKINPFGGCLPILIQIPVFIALYWMLLEAVELRQAPLGLWIGDLSSPDPFYVLPLLLGVAMYGQFKLNPAPTDPTQAMIMKIMPVGFAAFSIIMPSGLVLYWIANTALSIAQQWQITRSIDGPRRK